MMPGRLGSVISELKLNQKWMAVSGIVLIIGMFDVISAVLVLVIFFLAYHWNKTNPDLFSIKNIPWYFIVLVGLVGTLIPAFLAWLRWSDDYFSRMAFPNGAMYIEAGILIPAVVFGLLWINLKAKDTNRLVVPLTLVFFCLLKLFYVETISSEAVSDFRRMFELAQQWSNEGLPSNKDAVGFAEGIYGERVLFYLYPINVLFGDSETAYVYTNVAISILTSLFTYKITLWFFGVRPARVALVLALSSISVLQASNIPTHDIPGSLAVMATLFVYISISRSFQKGTVFRLFCVSFLLGLVLLWLEMQRGISSIMLLSILVVELFGFFSSSENEGFITRKSLAKLAQRMFFVLVFPIVIFSFSGDILESRNLKLDYSDIEARRLSKIIPHSESWGSGSYGNWADGWWPRRPPKDESLNFFVRRLVSDMYYSPVEQISHWIRKSRRLYGFGSHERFYLFDATIRGEKKFDRDDYRKSRQLNSSHLVIFLFLFSVGGYLFLMRRESTSEKHLPIIFLSIFSLIMLLITEVQARYLFPIWYIGPIYAAYGLHIIIGRLKNDDSNALDTN